MRYYGRRKGVNPHFEINRFEPKHGELEQQLSYESYALPQPYDQGAYPDCVGNVCAEDQALYHMKRKGAFIYPSRSAIYAGAKNIYEPSDVQMDGLQITDALLILIHQGYVLEQDWPYPTDPSGNDPGNMLTPVPENLWKKDFGSAGYLTINASSVKDMMYALSEHGPLVIGLSFAQEFENLGSDGFMDPKLAKTDAGGHCMHVLGFDQAKFGGCFRVRNSWGSDWGSNGDAFMPFSMWEEAPNFAPDEAYCTRFTEHTDVARAA